MALPILHSVEQTADLLSLSRWTVTRLIDDGELKAAKVRGKVMVSRASIDEYVARLLGEEQSA